MVIERACQRLGWNLAEQGCVVQGFGNVGGIAARELAGRGAKLLAVSDISGGIYSPAGLDSTTCARGSTHTGRWPATRTSTTCRTPSCSSSRATSSCSPRSRSSSRPRTRRASSASSSPRAPTGRRRSKRTRSSPSAGFRSSRTCLTNAGGVTVSYFEWVQDLGRLFWDREEIRARLADKLADAFDRVWNLAEEKQHLAAERGAGRRHQRGRLGARNSRDLSVSKVREAMVPEPRTLDAAAPATEAGELLARRRCGRSSSRGTASSSAC